MTTSTKPARLSIKNPADILSLIPYLLGFHVTESVVCILVGGNRIHATMRFDHEWLTAAPEQIQDCLKHGVEQVAEIAEPSVIIASYSTNLDKAHESAGIIETMCPSQLIIDSLVTDTKRWWSRMCMQEACCPPEGNTCERATPAAASAVLAGITALDSRDELYHLVEGPGIEDLRDAEALATKQQKYWGTRTLPQRKRALKSRLKSVLKAKSATMQQAVDIGLLCLDIEVRDSAWVMITRDNATQHVTLWSQVIGQVPESLSMAPICLLGMAAWAAGNGALQSCAIERANEVNPRYSMLRLLEDVTAAQAHPRLWDQVRADLIRADKAA